MEDQIHRFEKELKTVLHSVNNVLLNQPGPKDRSGIKPAFGQAPDVKKAEPAIEHLMGLLRESSLDADQGLLELKDLLYGSRFKDPMKSLEREISDFDCEKALSELVDLAGALGIKMSERD